MAGSPGCYPSPEYSGSALVGLTSLFGMARTSPGASAGKEEVILSALAWSVTKQKSPVFLRGLIIKDRQRLTLPGVILVPSALAGLTSLFGMGRGDPHRYSHLKTCPDVSGS